MLQSIQGGTRMTILSDSLRLWLTFYNELKQVGVLTSTNRFDGPPLRIMGMVEGEEKLEDLLDTVSIDCFLVTSGEPSTSSFACTAYTRSPKRIVEDLKKAFAKADEITQKILRGEEITEEEKLFRAPVSLTVCASDIPISEGVENVAAWFRIKASAAAAHN